jgi:hypothetical protein
VVRAECLNIMHGNIDFGNLMGKARGDKAWERWQAPIQASASLRLCLGRGGARLPISRQSPTPGVWL